MTIKTFKKVPSLSSLLSTFSKVEALIFDMDGTLLNTEILHALALETLLVERKVTKDLNLNLDSDELLKKFKGVSDPEVFEILRSAKIIDKEFSLLDFINEKNSFFQQQLDLPQIQNQLIHSEIITLLQDAKEEKIKLALVTASERSTTDLFLSNLNLKQYFDFIITRNDTLKTKPDPMPYLHSFKMLGAHANNILIFEDSHTGFQAAQASGAKVVRVCWYG